MAGNGQKVIELDRQRMEAMAKKDIGKLNELIANDLVYTHSSARLDTKQSLIGNMDPVQQCILQWRPRTSRRRISAIRSC